MARPLLTVMTDPIPYGHYFAIETAKHAVRRLRDIVKPRPLYMQSQYRGHFAVTRSLVEGLKKIGANTNYNPRSIADVGEVVIVLSGLAALRQTITLKRAGHIKKILAGPNILVFPSEHQGLIASPEVDLCIVPDQFTAKLYADDCPQLRNRLAAWPAGVDTSFWRPDPGIRNDKQILIYEKLAKGPVGPISDYVPILLKRGYTVEVIRYGQYLPPNYLRELQKASLMIGFSPTESQGIAWAEAWSTDVPMLSWYQDSYTYRGKTFNSSPAPYLSDKTGFFFRSLTEFEAAMSRWESNREAFQPRVWVNENMSDEICAKLLLKIAGLL